MILLIKVKGAVQGVGYRPFIAQKATEYGLKGYVKNIGAAVEILAAGDEDRLRAFSCLLKKEYPAGAFILDVEISEAKDESVEFEEFSIVESADVDLSSELPVFLPDIGICDDCLSVMLDESNVRYGYPLISCASCGPRISIADALPYDRDLLVRIIVPKRGAGAAGFAALSVRNNATDCYRRIFHAFVELDIAYKSFAAEAFRCQVEVLHALEFRQVGAAHVNPLGGIARRRQFAFRYHVALLAFLAQA